MNMHANPIKRAVLGTMTAASLSLMALPGFAYTAANNQPTQQEQAKGEKVANVSIKGMTCNVCENKVKDGVSKVKGVSDVKVSHEQGTAVVKYDPKKTSLPEIQKAVAASGFEVVSTKVN
ncbi:heavy metal-associated domain-containing protein [Nibrella saemangeumensis]